MFLRRLGMLSVSAVVLSVPALALAGENVAFDSLPAAVKATVTREVKGGQILDIERDKKKGQPIFEVEFMDGGVKWEIDIAQDGTLLSRQED